MGSEVGIYGFMDNSADRFISSAWLHFLVAENCADLDLQGYWIVSID